jgi:hypothetical protein
VEAGELGVYHQAVAELLGEPALELPGVAPHESERVRIRLLVAEKRMRQEEADGPALLLGEEGGVPLLRIILGVSQLKRPLPGRSSARPSPRRSG